MAIKDAASNPGPLEGHVEIDETYVGGKVKGKGRLTAVESVLGCSARARSSINIVRDIPDDPLEKYLPT